MSAESPSTACFNAAKNTRDRLQHERWESCKASMRADDAPAVSRIACSLSSCAAFEQVVQINVRRIE